MKFTINRNYWYRGRGSTDSMLLNSEGSMCCLGQICRQLGIDKDRIRYQRTPWSLNDKYAAADTIFSAGTFFTQFPENVKINVRNPITEADNSVVAILMEINDNYYLIDAQREMQLTDLVSHFFNHELEFVN